MVKKFRWLKLKTMISVLLFASVLLLLAAELGIRQMAYGKYNQLLHEKNEQMLITYSDYMETLFIRMENLTYSMIADDFLQENLTLLRDNPDSEGYLRLQDSVKNRLYNYVAQEEYFDSFFFRAKHFDYKYGKRYLDELEGFEDYLQVAQGAGGQARWIPQDQCLLLVREIRKSERLDFSNLGYIVAQIDFPSVMKNMHATLKHLEMDGNIAIFYGDICVYTNTQGLEHYKDMQEEWCIDGDHFISVYTSGKRGYTMVISTYYGAVQQTIQQAYWLSFMASVIIAGVILMISAYFVNQIIKELHFLIRRMDAFGEGILPDEKERQIYEKMPNEIGKMYRHFYRMTVNYKKLSDKYYTNMLLLKDAEISHIQKQMQPHFILNSLSIISWKAYSLQDEELRTIVDALGRIVKGFVQTGSQMASISSEMQMVEDYLYIQQIRFQERLKVHIDVSDYTMNRKIPRLCIQPLVENSIAYTMEEMLSECRIQIYDRVTADAVELVVEDNGPGFDENILEQLSEGTVKPRGNGMALRNIHERLRYAYSEQYGLYFVRLKDGMQVVIRLPKEEREASEKERGIGNENRI